MQTPPVHVDRLSADEGPRLRAIRLRALLDAPDAFGSTLEEAEAWSDDNWTDQLRALTTFVAVRGRLDVGMVRWARDGSDVATAWLLSMWTAPEARGQGIADALVDAVIASARAAGVVRIVLDVGDDNARAAAFYERKGFIRNGVVGHLPPPREHIREHQRELRLARSVLARSL